MRRKILSFILALTLMAGMGSIAYAADGDPVDKGEWNGNTQGDKPPTVNVYGKYEAATVNPVYKVYISWPDMTFKYSVKGERKWSPSTHTYDDSNLRYDWDPAKAVGTLTVDMQNYSNVPVKINAEWKPGGETYGLNIGFSDNDAEESTQQEQVALGSYSEFLTNKNSIELTVKSTKSYQPDTRVNNDPTKIGELILTVSAV